MYTPCVNNSRSFFIGICMYFCQCCCHEVTCDSTSVSPITSTNGRMRYYRVWNNFPAGNLTDAALTADYILVTLCPFAWNWKNPTDCSSEEYGIEVFPFVLCHFYYFHNSRSASFIAFHCNEWCTPLISWRNSGNFSFRCFLSCHLRTYQIK